MSTPNPPDMGRAAFALAWAATCLAKIFGKELAAASVRAAVDPAFTRLLAEDTEHILAAIAERVGIDEKLLAALLKAM